MPAPAVIPAPVVYFKVAAVKTLVVHLRVTRLLVANMMGSIITYWSD